MNPDTLNFLTTLAFVAINIDLGMQIWQVWQMQSSADVSISGVVIRTVAIFILLIKYTYIQDPVLIWGQVVIATLILYYLTLLIRLRSKKPKPLKRKSTNSRIKV